MPNLWNRFWSEVTLTLKSEQWQHSVFPAKATTTCDAAKTVVMRTWRSPHDHMDGCRARNLTVHHYLFFLYNFRPSLTLFSPPSLAPVVIVTTRPSSPRCRCRTRHARGSLTPSRLCPSQPLPRATTDAEGEVSPWPSTSRSARPTATVLNMDTLSESPSESMCPCFCVCVLWMTLCEKQGGLKMEASVTDEIHLKCIIEWKEKEMSRNLSHCSNELRQISGLCPNGNVSVPRKVFEEFFTIFFCFFIQSGRRLHQSRCEKLHSCWR